MIEMRDNAQLLQHFRTAVPIFSKSSDAGKYFYPDFYSPGGKPGTLKLTNPIHQKKMTYRQKGEPEDPAKVRHVYMRSHNKVGNIMKCPHWGPTWEDVQHRPASQRQHRKMLESNSPGHIKTLTGAGQCRAPDSKWMEHQRDFGWGYDPEKLALPNSIKILEEADVERKYDLLIDAYWRPEIIQKEHLLDGGGPGAHDSWENHRAPKGGFVLSYVLWRVMNKLSMIWFDTEFYAGCRCPWKDYLNDCMWTEETHPRSCFM